MNVETPQLDTVIIEVFSWRVKPETYYTETVKGQTFAINEFKTYGDTLDQLAVLT